MRLFWKQFIGILMILVVMFTLFGSVLIQTSFQTALDREVEAALEEATLFHYTLLSSAESMSNTYSLDQKVIIELLKTIDENAGNTADVLVLYDANRAVLYRRGKETNNLPIQMRNFDELVWQLTEREEIHYLDTMVRLKLGKSDYYIEKNRNVQQVYESRDLLLAQYRAVVGILMGVACVFAALLAYGFTAPVRRLSQATKAFATGDYRSRVKPMGRDELTVLMKDYNSMADQLETNIWELNDAVRRQEEFTGAFAHELKTPLTSIIGYSEMLMSTSLSEEARMMAAGYIYQDGKRLERLAYKMMELARVDKQEIPFAVLEVTELVNLLQSTTLPMMMEKGVKLFVKVEEGRVFGDKDLLLSLLFNLADNARKACQKGGQIILLGRKAGNGYQLEIRDNGRGIPSEDLPYITEAFYMGDKSRARKEGGAGLGMTLCAKILKLHGGRWRIKSKPGKGTVIGIWLPRKEAQ